MNYTENEMRRYRCCFTGHRIGQKNWEICSSTAVYRMLRTVVREDDYSTNRCPSCSVSQDEK